MQKNIQFQELTSTLHDIYIEIGIKSYNQHYRHLWPKGNTITYIQHSFTKRILEEEEKNQNSVLFLIKFNTEYVGLLKVTLHKSLMDYDQNDALYLDKIYILKEYAGKGIGGASLKFVESIAQNLSKKAIFLESMQKGPALPFYLVNNFKIVDESTVPFSNVIEEEKPMYLLKRTL